MTSDEKVAPILNNRYELLESLGTGGMGPVYRAQDRLLRQTVALKRVMLRGESSEPSALISRNDSVDFRLALAQEFKTLASMHHPNIISVQDYGFDSGK